MSIRPEAPFKGRVTMETQYPSPTPSVQTARAFCSIYLDRDGNVVEVLDEDGKPRQITPTKEEIPPKVGGRTPNGMIIKAVQTIDVVTVETEEDHDDPCWIRDPRGNWRCVCSRPPCP
jgi:hypothetical protein